MYANLNSFAPAVWMVLVGVAAMIIASRRWHGSWRVLGAGAALWIGAVALKFGCAVLGNAFVNRWLHAELPRGCADAVFWCYVGLLTGIFECGIFLLVAPLIRRRQWRWGDAMSFGVGFGAVEALGVAVAAGIGAAKAGAASGWGAWIGALLPAFERVIALAIHVAATVMILRALMDRQWRWFWISFLYKSAVDCVAAWVILSGTRLRSSPLLMELICFLPFALIGLWVLSYLRREWDKPGFRFIFARADASRETASGWLLDRPQTRP
jgi:uncharacterized membrane protein YhfC